MKTHINRALKALPLVLMLFTLPASAGVENREQQARELYQAALTAANQGNRELARNTLHQVLAIYPNHPQAKRMLASLTPRLENLADNNRKAALAKVIIPKIDLEQTSIRESLDILQLQIAATSGNKVTPNFIVQDLGKAFNGRTVTLQLKGIPADVLLHYIVDQVRGKIHYDKHAIVISPIR